MAAPWPPGSCPRRARCEAFGWGLELWGGARQWMRRRGLSGPAVLGAARTLSPMMGRREAPVGSGEALARRGAATELQTELLGSRCPVDSHGEHDSITVPMAGGAGCTCLLSSGRDPHTESQLCPFFSLSTQCTAARAPSLEAWAGQLWSRTKLEWLGCLWY